MDKRKTVAKLDFPHHSEGFISPGEIPTWIPRMKTPEVEIDPVTFAVIGGAIFSICRQMEITLRNTSLSPILNIGTDFSCAIFTADAQLVAQACNCPGHVGSMHYAVMSCIRSFGMDNIKEGDVFILNDPYAGGTHLPDVSIITPVFYEGKLLMFTGNRAHHSDIGGSCPGSFPMSTEIFEEGIRIPPLKYFEGGKRVESIMAILVANVRTPREVKGDVEAQLAANNIGGQELVALINKYGKDVVLGTMLRYMDYSERAFRINLKIPEGSYEAEDWMDGDGTNEGKQRIKVKITIKESKAYVDFSGTEKQVRGPINCVFPVTVAMVVSTFLSLTDPDIMPNHGFYRPIYVKAPEGTLVNPKFPAPAVGFPDTANRIVEVIMEALTPAIPERVIAATSGTTTNNHMGGTNPITGEPYVWYNINSQGGWGGRATADGWHNVCFVEANGSDIPVETIEYRYPWRVLEYRLRDDLVGAGKWRGGSGNYFALTPVGHDATLTVNGDRAVTPPYGIFGGKPGATARCTIQRSNGKSDRISPKMMKQDKINVGSGDVIIIETPCGGGYGNPLERDVELVRKDVKDGLISIASARRDYGVIIKAKTFEIDIGETEKLRAKMWKEYEKIKDGLPTIDRKGYVLHAEETA